MDQKSSFIASELWILAWGASVQRSNLYKKDLDSYKDKSKTEIFSHKIIKYISSELIPEYKELVTEDKHYKNIEKLIKFAEDNDGGILTEAGYKYGIAQKLFNLILNIIGVSGAL